MISLTYGQPEQFRRLIYTSFTNLLAEFTVKTKKPSRVQVPTVLCSPADTRDSIIYISVLSSRNARRLVIDLRTHPPLDQKSKKYHKLTQQQSPSKLICSRLNGHHNSHRSTLIISLLQSHKFQRIQQQPLRLILLPSQFQLWLPEVSLGQRPIRSDGVPSL